MNYSFSQLYNLLMQNGGAEIGANVVRILAAIGIAESNGDANVRRYCSGNGYCQITRNGRTYTEREYPNQSPEDSIGLWQVNRKAWNYSPEILKNPQANAKIAIDIYKKQGLKAWGSYSNGSYKKYLSGVSNENSYSGRIYSGNYIEQTNFNKNAVVIGANNRYLIAFAILVLIFIFAFN